MKAWRMIRISVASILLLMVVSLKSIVGCFRSSARRGRNNKKKPVDRISTSPDDHHIEPVYRIRALPDGVIHHIEPVDRISTVPDDVNHHNEPVDSISTLPDGVIHHIQPIDITSTDDDVIHHIQPVDGISKDDDVIHHIKPVDRISTLSDDVIHLILSFISIKCAIRTSVLSKRWKHIHKSLPYFNLDDADGIVDLEGYYRRVINLLRNRDSESPVSALSLRYDSKFDSRKFESMVKKVIHYAILYKVNDLSFYDLYNNKFPDVLKSESLKRLRFTQSKGYTSIKCKTLDWYLPALVSLHLERARLGDEGRAGSGGNVDFFSRFENLKHLTLIHCDIVNLSEIEIFGPRLESLTLVNNWPYSKVKCKLSNWYLPTLISLHLEKAALGDEGSTGSGGNVDFFSRFENLKHLKLIHCDIVNPSEIEIFGPRLESITLNSKVKCKISDWYLPALVSLHLEQAVLGDEGSAASGGNVDLFSRFENMKHLKLINCDLVNLSEIEIFGPQLRSLTLVRIGHVSEGYIKCKTSDWYLPALVCLHLECVALGKEGSTGSGGNVDPFSRFENLKHLKLINIWNFSKIEIFCPRLESLTLVNNLCKFVVSAPKLLSFCYDGYHLSYLSMSVPCLTLSEVSLSAGDLHVIAEKSEVMHWLQQFSSTKFLSLRNRSAMVLYLGLDLGKHQPYSLFSQLQHLDIAKSPSFTPSDAHIVDRVTSYFLSSSPSATVNLI